MRGNPITGQARGPSIADTVARGQRILEDRPEPQDSSSADSLQDALTMER